MEWENAGFKPVCIHTKSIQAQCLPFATGGEQTSKILWYFYR